MIETNLSETVNTTATAEPQTKTKREGPPMSQEVVV